MQISDACCHATHRRTEETRSYPRCCHMPPLLAMLVGQTPPGAAACCLVGAPRLRTWKVSKYRLACTVIQGILTVFPALLTRGHRTGGHHWEHGSIRASAGTLRRQGSSRTHRTGYRFWPSRVSSSTLLSRNQYIGAREHRPRRQLPAHPPINKYAQRQNRLTEAGVLKQVPERHHGCGRSTSRLVQATLNEHRLYGVCCWVRSPKNRSKARAAQRARVARQDARGTSPRPDQARSHRPQTEHKRRRCAIPKNVYVRTDSCRTARTRQFPQQQHQPWHGHLIGRIHRTSGHSRQALPKCLCWKSY